MVVEPPIQNNRLPDTDAAGSGNNVPVALSVAKVVLVQPFVMVAVTVIGVDVATVYHVTVAFWVPCPAVTLPAVAGLTVHCTVVFAGNDDKLKLFCPLLQRLPPPVIVGAGITPMFSTAAGD